MSDDQQEAYAQELMQERERESEQALDEALEKGVSVKALRTLARETGCVRWALQHSIKEHRQ